MVYPDGGERKEKREDAKGKHNMRMMIYFSIMYAADVGGTGVITGTGPNMVLKAVLEE